MINLMPPKTKQAYTYASKNQKLLTWIVAMVAGLIGLVAIGTFGAVNLHRSLNTNTASVNSLQKQLTDEHLNAIQHQIQSISDDFSLVVKVLSQEVLFSKLLSKMAAALPAGANLTALNIADTASGSGLDITAEATNYTVASQVQVNLADPANGIFSKADLVSITCASGANNSYPCSVVLRAEFAPNNQFLFINQGGKS